MACGDLSEQGWVLIEGLLPAERGDSLDLRWIIAVISTVCFMFCELAVPARYA